MPSENPVRRIRLWSGLIVVFAFLAGAAAGAGLHARMRPHGGFHNSPFHPPPHGKLPPHLEELQLTPEQEEKAKTIFTKERSTIEAVLHEGFPRARAAHEEADRELRAILTPPQIQKLDEFRARHPFPSGPMGFRRGAEEGPGGPPPPGMGPLPAPPPGAPPPRAP